MITDFPEIKKEFHKLLNSIVRRSFKENSPMTSLASKKTLYDGDKMGTLYPNGRHEIRELKLIESKFSIPQKDIPTMKPEELISKVVGLATDMAGQMERGLIEVIEGNTKGNDSTIIGNPVLSLDSILAGLERITVNFVNDDRTKPVKPTIFAGPDVIEEYKAYISNLTPEEKEEFQKKEALILDKKYTEHLKDLESRKIVD